jgi:mycofactocin precursor
LIQALSAVTLGNTASLALSATKAAGINAASTHGSGGSYMAERPDEELTADELLVEEVSIDGMCGVY